MYSVKLKLFYNEGGVDKQQDVNINVPLDKEEILKGINSIIKNRYMSIIKEEKSLNGVIIDRFVVDEKSIKEVKDGLKIFEKSLEQMDQKELQLYVIYKNLFGVETYMANSNSEIIQQIKQAETRKAKEEEERKLANSPLKDMNKEQVETIKEVVKGEVMKELGDIKETMRQEILAELKEKAKQNEKNEVKAENV